MPEIFIRGQDLENQDPDFVMVGRDEELKRLCAILMRKKSNSILLNGPGGVGVSSLTKGLQYAKNNPEMPFDIITKRFYWMDTDALFSIDKTEDANNAFQRLMRELNDTPDTVLVIQEISSFIEAARNIGCSHFLSSLTLAVKNNKTQAIFEVRDDKIDSTVRAYPELAEYFTFEDVEEPTGENLLKIVTSQATKLGKFHNIKVDISAIEMAIELNTKYRSKDASLARAQPERSITLVDRALASFRYNSHEGTSPETRTKLQTFYQKQRNAEVELAKLIEDLESLQSVHDAKIKDGIKSAASDFMSLDTPEIENQKKKIELKKKIISEYQTAYEDIVNSVDSKLILTADMVKHEFANITGYDLAKLDENEMDKLRNLPSVLKNKIFGQEEALNAICNGVRVFTIGKRSRVPLPFLAMGPSGVGKTETFKILAKELEREFIKFDMSDYMEKHAVAKLIGAPPGYEGFDEKGGILTRAVRNYPEALFLFDEIEKAHPDVFNVLLAVMSDGKLLDPIGRELNFSRAFLGLTTNIGQKFFIQEDNVLSASHAREIGFIIPENINEITVTWDMCVQAAHEELKSTYRSEFLNRINGRQNILCYRNLNLTSITKIAIREIQSINDNYADNGISVVVDNASLDALCKDRYDKVEGARGLPGYIQANLEPLIVNRILENKPKAIMSVAYTNKKFVTTFKE